MMNGVKVNNNSFKSFWGPESTDFREGAEGQNSQLVQIVLIQPTPMSRILIFLL